MTVSFSGPEASTPAVDSPLTPGVGVGVEPRNSADSKFKEQYGKGFKLTFKDVVDEPNRR